ncbi:MAG: hypothetical protein AAFY56_09370, partial [Pseudomonadota bacterium]
LAIAVRVASGVAWSVFRHIERDVDEVTQESVPGFVAALRIAVRVASTRKAIESLLFMPKRPGCFMRDN